VRLEKIKEFNMAFSDCPECWDTPCTCGHEWKQLSVEALEEHLEMIREVLEGKYNEEG